MSGDHAAIRRWAAREQAARGDRAREAAGLAGGGLKAAAGAARPRRVGKIMTGTVSNLRSARLLMARCDDDESAASSRRAFTFIKRQPEFRARRHGACSRAGPSRVTRNGSRAFQGVVIGSAAGGTRETFTVRKISGGIGVERTSLCTSPYAQP